MSDSTQEERIEVCNGKYTFVIPPDDHRIHVLWDDDPWLIIEKGHRAIAALIREFYELQSTTYCAYCGESYPLDAESCEKVGAHIAKCPNHPMRDVEVARDILKNELDFMREMEEKYRQWVSDLQSRMYVNCVYCGHRYGPKDDTPSTMADVLKEHIEQCPEHPMSKLKARLSEVEQENEQLKEKLNSHRRCDQALSDLGESLGVIRPARRFRKKG